MIKAMQTELDCVNKNYTIDLSMLRRKKYKIIIFQLLIIDKDTVLAFKCILAHHSIVEIKSYAHFIESLSVLV